MKEITRINDADIMYNAITGRLRTATISEEEGALKIGILDGLMEIDKARQAGGPEAVTMMAAKHKRRWFGKKKK